MVNWSLLVLLIVWNSTARAFDAEAYYGRQEVQDNSLFQSDDGQGTEYGGRLLAYPGTQVFWGLGAYYSTVRYKLESSREVEGVSLAGTGTFDGDYYGPCIQLTAPIPYLTFYSGFSYIKGSYRYNLNKASSLTSASGDSLVEKLQSQVHLDAVGLNSFLGIKTSGRYSFFLEFGQSFQTLTIASINVRAATYINNSVQGRDSQQVPYNDSFDDLIGQSFNFSTRSCLGVSNFLFRK
jgi:hypothetical protein